MPPDYPGGSTENSEEGPRPSEERPQQRVEPRQQKTESSADAFGLTVETLTKEKAAGLGLRSVGVLITHVANGSPAELAGLAEGMVIVSLRYPIATETGYKRRQIEAGG